MLLSLLQMLACLSTPQLQASSIDISQQLLLLQLLASLGIPVSPSMSPESILYFLCW